MRSRSYHKRQRLAVLPLVSTIAAAVTAFSTIAPSKTSTKIINAASLGLGKKSTAKDVLKELNKADCLASYVSNKGTAVVTGASSGIGIPTAEAFALSGMDVVLACRNVADGEKVMSSLPSWCQDSVRVVELDLSDLGSVQQAASDILAQGSVDVLVNNAGVMNIPTRQETKDGFEMQLGVNHIGHHFFTRLLLSGVNKGGRIVTVASSAHNFGDFGDFSVSDLNYNSTGTSRAYSPWGAYGQSKLANILFSKALNDRLKDNGNDIVSVSLHPGVIATNLWRSTTPDFVQPLLKGIVGDRSIEQGAGTSMYASLVESSAFKSGGEYLSDCKVVEPNNKGKDADGRFRQQLWDRTEEMIGDAGYELPKTLMG